MTPTVPSPADEKRHVPGPDPWWSEAWSFDFATPDASLGGYVHLELLPNQGLCWYWAGLVGLGRDLVTVLDHEVPLPRPPGLEVRTEGLWAEHLVETAFDHVSVGCEAFALRLDDPAEALGPLRGVRVPFGLDLGWETAAGATPAPAGSHRAGYALACDVVGEVLVGDERIGLDGLGWRHHTWGPVDWWSGAWGSIAGRMDDGTWLRDDLPVEVDPVGFAPVVVAAGDGRTSQVARALCRLEDVRYRRRRGVGWLTWNQPGSTG